MNESERFNLGYRALAVKINEGARNGVFSASYELASLPVYQFIRKDFPDLKEPMLQIQLGYSDEVLLHFYALATQFLEEKMQEEALNSFTFLTMLNPYISSFWIGLGQAYESKQQYEQAIEAYAKAVEMEPADFTPFVGMVHCGQESRNFARVKELLEANRESPDVQKEVLEALAYVKSKE
jgi:tetratricopeptide (TPR) repeat protein